MGLQGREAKADSESEIRRLKTEVASLRDRRVAQKQDALQ